MIFSLPTSYMGGHPGSAYKSLVIAVSSGVRWGHIPPRGKQTCFLLKRDPPGVSRTVPNAYLERGSMSNCDFVAFQTLDQLFVQNISIAHLNPNKTVIRGASVYFCVRERKIETERQSEKGRQSREERIFFSSVEKHNILSRGRDNRIEVSFQLHTS